MRISDWSSDVCSSDLSRPKATTLMKCCATMQAEWVATCSRRPKRIDFTMAETKVPVAPKNMVRKLEKAPVATTLKRPGAPSGGRSEEHTSELQSLMRISYAVFCLKKKKDKHNEK